MKNQKILKNPSIVKKETLYKVYKLLFFRNKNIKRNNLRYFKFYFFFKFHFFFKFYFLKKKKLFDYCIVPKKKDNNFYKLQLINNSYITFKKQNFDSNISKNRLTLNTFKNNDQVIFNKKINSTNNLFYFNIISNLYLKNN